MAAGMFILMFCICVRSQQFCLKFTSHLHAALRLPSFSDSSKSLFSAGNCLCERINTRKLGASGTVDLK